MTESMREVFESAYPIPKHLFWNAEANEYNIKQEYVGSIAAMCNCEEYLEKWDVWQAASTQPQQWIKCSDRLPSDLDADPQCKVWGGNPERGILLMHWWRVEHNPDVTHWMPTNLKRPEPPKE